MTDINIQPGPNPARSPPEAGFLEEELRQGIEMLFFAYRDFTGDADTFLAKVGFGRAHHRVIYFVGRYPGLTISELLAILRITKQSLNRVLARLVEDGYIERHPGSRDRRRRHLTLTAKGRELEQDLTAIQRCRVGQAFRTAGAEGALGFRQVLLAIMDSDEDRKRFEVPLAKG